MLKIIVVLAIAGFLIYFFQTKLWKKYLEKQFMDIQNSNYANDEIEYHKKRFSQTETADLQNLLNTSNITENEKKAIKIIFSERQIIPPTDPCNFS